MGGPIGAGAGAGAGWNGEGMRRNIPDWSSFCIQYGVYQYQIHKADLSRDIGMLSGYNVVSRTGMGLICLPTVLNPLVACWVRSMGVMRDGCARSTLAARDRVDCMLGSFVSEWRGVRAGSIATMTSRCRWWWCCLLRLLPSSLPARSSAELRTRQPSSPPSNQRHACTGHAAVPLPCSSTTSPSAAAR